MFGLRVSLSGRSGPPVCAAAIVGNRMAIAAATAANAARRHASVVARTVYNLPRAIDPLQVEGDLPKRRWLLCRNLLLGNRVDEDAVVDVLVVDLGFVGFGPDDPEVVLDVPLGGL